MKIKLDAEERALSKSLEKGEWHSIPNVETYKKHLQQVAKNTVNKTQRINLRLTPKDVEEARVKGVREGMPYQTLLASVIHKYLAGNLVEKARVRRS